MLVFLHIPKTAGTTLRELARQQVGSGRCLVVDDVSRVSYRSDSWLAGHEFVAGHFGASIFARLPPGARVFTMLRDPVARVRSQFRYFSELAARDVDFNAYRSRFLGRSIEEVLADRLDPFVNSFFRDTQAWALVSDHQHHYRHPDAHPDEVLAIARRNLAAMDCFGLVERMADSVRLLNARFGWRIPPAAAEGVRENASGPVAAAPDRDPAIDQLIRAHNPLDVALHEWAVAEFDRRVATLGVEVPEAAPPLGERPPTEIRHLVMEPGMANGERTVDGLLERVAKVEAANAELVSLNARLQAWAAESERLRTTLDLDAKSLRSWAEANESRVAGLRARIAELESSRGGCPTTPPGAAR